MILSRCLYQTTATIAQPVTPVKINSGAKQNRGPRRSPSSVMNYKTGRINKPINSAALDNHIPVRIRDIISS